VGCPRSGRPPPDEEKLSKKTIKEIQWDADEEITRITHLAREAKRGKRHNDLQDDSGALDDDPRDDTPVRRHHPKFNSRCPADRDQLRNRS
jgi:hypothetical protein